MDGGLAPDLTWITGDLAVGGYLPPGAAALLAAGHGVGYVVDMRAEACDDATELAASGLKFVRLPTPDHHAPTQDQLDEGVAFAEAARAAGAKILIHCQHGIGRSVTLALCVLVDRGLQPLAALARAKDVRELVSPSPAQYEAWAAWMRRRAPWTAIPQFEAFTAIAYRHLAARA
ncbi:MAG: dual specificity protein phosphatase [Phenylobacterium sp.]|nr:dual specificity protein phosphatase [Phenylobacterium sp.]